jgi:hypothetical protein
MMRRIVRISLALSAVALAGAQLVRPARTNPLSNPGEAMAAHINVPADVAAILDRSCRDCHSNETRWPWYSHVAPVSWLVIDHVNHGRSHLNVSEWARYDRPRQAELLKNSCELARKGAMPMPSYLLMHRAAGLSPADAETLCDWAMPTPAH